MGSNLNQNPNEGPGDDFLEQILSYQNYSTETNLSQPNMPMMLQLNNNNNSGDRLSGYHGTVNNNNNINIKGGFDPMGIGKRFRDHVSSSSMKNHILKEKMRERHKHEFQNSVDRSRQALLGIVAKNCVEAFSGQPMSNAAAAVPHPPAIRPRVRARRGQATDPHSIAERLRRERISERIRALQDLVPSVNKTDRAAMLDEIVDYVKFLRLQVKVLSMSRLGEAGAVAPLLTDIPLSSVEDETSEGGRSQPAWEKWSSDGTERQFAKLMEENVGAAMQFLQSKALCIIPISLASAIYHTQPPDSTSIVKPETHPSS